jgi:hypothetical protein
VQSLSKILSQAENLEALTEIPNVIELMSLECDIDTLEKSWTKELKQSDAKSKTWLFRQAVGMALWYRILEKKAADLGASPKSYFASWATDILGISGDLAHKRRRAGEFVLKIRYRNLTTPEDASLSLPAAYSNLVELSALSDDDLDKAVITGLISEHTTTDDIRSFKASLKAKYKKTECNLLPQLGCVYALINIGMPGLIKVGFSMEVHRRLFELSQQTGVPFPFKLAWQYDTPTPQLLEAQLHEALSAYRVNPNKEFFQISIEEFLSIATTVIEE